jgi:hypothetical protein
MGDEIGRQAYPELRSSSYIFCHDDSIFWIDLPEKKRFCTDPA